MGLGRSGRASGRWRVDRVSVMVAEQRDAVAFEVAAQAVGSGFVRNGDPKDRHRADDLTDPRLPRSFVRSDVARRAGSAGPRGGC